MKYYIDPISGAVMPAEEIDTTEVEVELEQVEQGVYEEPTVDVEFVPEDEPTPNEGPIHIEILEQEVITGPDGTSTVNIILGVDEVPGVQEYEVQIGL